MNGWALKHRVSIVSYGETPVNRQRKPSMTIEQYYAWAAKLSLEKAGLTRKELDGQGIALLEPQTIIPMWSQQIIQDLGLHPRLVIRSDHGGVGAGALLEQAAMAIHSGLVDLVLCVCADAPLGYLRHGAVAPQRFIENFMIPFGLMGPNSLIALVAQRYIYQYGITAEQVGRLSVVQRYHASLNPNAYLKKEITIEDYLNSKLISDPIRLFDCCIPVNGGLSFIMASSKRAKEITDKPVHLLGIGECYNYYHGDPPDLTYSGIIKASKEAFAKAGMKHSDVSFLQIYDDYTYAVLIQLEDLGFCPKGSSGKFLETADITVKGELPINTGGGQLSAGQPGMAGSFVPVVETIRQLRGEGGARQVKNARAGLFSLIGGIGQWGASFVNTCVGILGAGVEDIYAGK